MFVLKTLTYKTLNFVKQTNAVPTVSVDEELHGVKLDDTWWEEIEVQQSVT